MLRQGFSGESLDEMSLKEQFHPLLRDARAVLFDVGGTLLHPDWQRLADLCRAETGRAVELDEMRRMLREGLHHADTCLLRGESAPPDTQRPGWAFRRMFAALGFDKHASDRLIALTDESHKARHLWCELDREAPRVLARLKRAGLRIAVISNTEDGRLEELLELVEIAAHFDFLIDSYVVGARKPDAAIFHLALKRLEIAPHEAVYIGDLLGHDVRSAEAVGMRAILIDPLDLYRENDCTRIRSLARLTNNGSLNDE